MISKCLTKHSIRFNMDAISIELNEQHITFMQHLLMFTKRLVAMAETEKEQLIYYWISL